MPFPTPRAVICSPSHIKKMVPPVNVMTTVMPAWISKDTSCSTRVSPYAASMSSTDTTGIATLLGLGFSSRLKLRTAHSDLV